MSLGPKWSDTLSDDLANTVFHIKCRLPHGNVERNVKSDVEIDYDQLEQQLQDTPTIYAFYSSLLAEAKLDVALKTRKARVRRARAMDELVEAARSQDRNLRRQDLEDLVEADDEYNKLSAELMLAEKAESKLFGVVSALRLKAEALRSLAGFKKQEMQELSE